LEVNEQPRLGWSLRRNCNSFAGFHLRKLHNETNFNPANNACQANSYKRA
jgi:hypothetical protein